MSEETNQTQMTWSELPLVVPKDAVLFPEVTTQLLTRIDVSRASLERAVAEGNPVLFASRRDSGEVAPSRDDMYRVGVTGIVKAMSPFPDGSVRLLVRGQNRVRIKRLWNAGEQMLADVSEFPEVATDHPEEIALTRYLSRQFQRMVELVPGLSDELADRARGMEGHAARMANFIAVGLDMELAEKQRLLETESVRTRLERLTVLLNRELSVIEAGNRIQNQVMDEVGQSQRQHYLREQMKIIGKELGDEEVDEIEELAASIRSAKLSGETEEQAMRELERLRQMTPAAAEYTTVRTYLDWLVEMPWTRASRDRLDIGRAWRILDQDHEGLQQVKERMLEYLAVRKLNPDSRGPILCFVGPPGVGKTSLGQSIARALGRKFARISLGGVDDEAEIRGHRRTYIGSLPGRIVQSLRRVGTNNPVLMFDEIDKVGATYRAIRRRRCWRSSIRSRISASSTTISTLPSTCPG